MIKMEPPLFRKSVMLDIAFASLIIGGLLYVCRVFVIDGYLPPPFTYDTVDNFMDWYNTAYWANNPGAYSIWGTVYPPLAFVFIKIFSIKSCYIDGPFAGRACDWLGIAALAAFFTINVPIVFKSYSLRDGKTAVIRTFALCFGLPMIFVLDRGNLVLPCFTLFAIGHGRVLRSAKLRWLAVAMTVNFKPYLVATLAPLVVRRRWRRLEGIVIFGIGLFLVTWALLGVGSPGEVIGNIFAYQDAGGNAPFAAMFYGSSYVSLLSLARSVPLTNFVGSRLVEIIDPLPSLLIHLGQLGVIASFVAVAFRPLAVSSYRLAALSVAMALSSVEVGGYAQIFLIFLVFFECWKGPATFVALSAAYILCVPFDHMAVHIVDQNKPAWLSGRYIVYDYGVSMGMFIRPGLILLIQYALSLSTVIDVLKWKPAKPLGHALSEPSGPAQGSLGVA